MKKRIGLIGAGNRTINYNLPILKLMSDDLEIVGVTTKSGKLHRRMDVAAPVFTSITKMVAETKPDILIISIKSNTVTEVLDEVISTNVPFVLETTDNYSIYNTISESGAKAGVLEQWPFLPLEQFKKMVLESGVLGQILSVENDYRTYDYHGAAQLRNYLAGETTPKIISLKSVENNYRSEFYVDKEGESKMPALEKIRAKVGLFENGTMLIYKFSDKHKNMPFRKFRSLKVAGSKGSIIGDCLLEGECEISVLDDEGLSHDLKIEQKFKEEIVDTISCVLPDGRTIEWKNKIGELSEHQLATAHLFQEMLINDNMFYSVDNAMQDMVVSYAGG
tara:strand:- start:987 stop:1991 length:1005 start_codon:yes stop_codon:yes gene_type:complete